MTKPRLLPPLTFPLASFAVACALSFSPSAKAAMISEACQLNQITAVSPLKEDLNYTRGSGRGADAIFTKESSDARLGNLSFSVAAGDQVQLQTLNNNTRVYILKKARTDVVFQMSVYPPSFSGGKYGSQPVPGTPSSAQLTYTSQNQRTPIVLGNFSCN